MSGSIEFKCFSLRKIKIVDLEALHWWKMCCYGSASLEISSALLLFSSQNYGKVHIWFRFLIIDWVWCLIDWIMSLTFYELFLIDCFYYSINYSLKIWFLFKSFNKLFLEFQLIDFRFKESKNFTFTILIFLLFGVLYRVRIFYCWINCLFYSIGWFCAIVLY